MRRSLLIVLLSASLGLAACGSDAAETGDDAGSATTERAAPTTVEGQGSPATDAAPGDTEPATVDTEPATVDTEPATADTESGSEDTEPGTEFSGADSEEFCARARSFEDADPMSDIFTTEDPAVIEAEWDEFETLIGDIVEAAPAEIAPDFETVAATFGLLRTAYERAGWDLLAVYDVVEADPELLAAFEGTDPEVEAAGARIDAYLDQVCGIAPE